MAKKARKRKRKVPIAIVQIAALSAVDVKIVKGARRILGINAHRIVNRIIAEVTQAVSANGKNVGNGAFAEWRPKLLDSVLNNLFLGAVWDATAEANVLAVAWDMGTIASLLSGGNTNVAKSQMHAAFNAVQQAHATCGAAMGGGTWCDFSM